MYAFSCFIVGYYVCRLGCFSNRKRMLLFEKRATLFCLFAAGLVTTLEKASSDSWPSDNSATLQPFADEMSRDQFYETLSSADNCFDKFYR
jgi:hypothetical protein